MRFSGVLWFRDGERWREIRCVHWLAKSYGGVRRCAGWWREEREKQMKVGWFLVAGEENKEEREIGWFATMAVEMEGEKDPVMFFQLVVRRGGTLVGEKLNGEGRGVCPSTDGEREKGECAGGEDWFHRC
ncbi:hypothetical protein HAX54_015889 [Datura stramonium]|uniref:Uncharacterized protein n=1 Tax=Datura stramonium TaxID=4076 RepID=A0ABS8S1U8_DATST|nr:hypothetical protein [Datura stramonium]